MEEAQSLTSPDPECRTQDRKIIQNQGIPKWILRRPIALRIGRIGRFKNRPAAPFRPTASECRRRAAGG
eukprot:scaffold13910_cov96-Isochrysis_galbana.AAC.1